MAYYPGLEGLRGLSALPDGGKEWLDQNPQYKGDLDRANRVFKNRYFINQYGMDMFSSMNVADRDALVEKTYANTLRNVLSPFEEIKDEDGNYLKTRFNPNKGLGSRELYNKAMEMSDEYLIKLNERGYIPSGVFEDIYSENFDYWQNVGKRTMEGLEVGMAAGVVSSGIATATGVGAVLDPLLLTILPIATTLGGAAYGILEGGFSKKSLPLNEMRDDNNRIFDDTYKEWRNNVMSKNKENTEYVYNQLLGVPDDEVLDKFNKFITPDKENGYGGVGAYYSFKDRGPMKNFTAQDARNFLARATTAYETLGPIAAQEQINTDAQNYIADHQSWWFKQCSEAAGLGITTINSIVSDALAIDNAILSAVPNATVYMDVNGDIIDTTAYKIQQKPDGSFYYIDDAGKEVPVFQEEMNRGTLQLMGLNGDGSKRSMLISPAYWNKVEATKSFLPSVHEMYDLTGSAPTMAAYREDEETPEFYQIMNMGAQMAATVAKNYIPIKMLSKGAALATATKKSTQMLGKGMQTVGKTWMAINPGKDAASIGYLYESSYFNESTFNRLKELDERFTNEATVRVMNKYNSDASFRNNIENYVQIELNKIYEQYNNNGSNGFVNWGALEEDIRRQALLEAVSYEVDESIARGEYAAGKAQAERAAGNAAIELYAAEAVKYGIHGYLGYRKYLYQTPAQRAQVSIGEHLSTIGPGNKTFNRVAHRIVYGGNGVQQVEGRIMLAPPSKRRIIANAVWKQAIVGGGFSNSLDEQFVAGAERIAHDSYSNYLNNYYNDESVATTYGIFDNVMSFMSGVNDSAFAPRTRNAFLIGLGGTATGVLVPNVNNIGGLITQARADRALNKKQGIKSREGKNVNVDFWGKKWYERWNDLVQFGVLNEYVAQKQSYAALNNQITYVNSMLDALDKSDDLKYIFNNMALNLAEEHATTQESLESITFEKALNAAIELSRMEQGAFDNFQTINNLKPNTEDGRNAAALLLSRSEKVQKESALIKKLANGEKLTEEETSEVLARYYSTNKESRNAEKDAGAIESVRNNAAEIQKAREAYEQKRKIVDKAVDKYNKKHKSKDKSVFFDRYKVSEYTKDDIAKKLALIDRWKEKRSAVEKEISGRTGVNDEANVLYETEEAINSMLSSNKMVHNEIASSIKTSEENIDKAKDEIYKIKSKYKYLSEISQEDAQAIAMYEFAINTEEAKIRSLQAQSDYLNSQDDKIRYNEKNRSEVVSAPRILDIDARTRAKMLEHPELFSKEQQEEIQALRDNILLNYGTDMLDKISYAATLAERIETIEAASKKLLYDPNMAEALINSSFGLENDALSDAAYKIASQAFEQLVLGLEYQGKSKEEISEVILPDLASFSLGTLEIMANDKSEFYQEYKDAIDAALDIVRSLDDIKEAIGIKNETLPWDKKFELIIAMADLIRSSRSSKDLLDKIYEFFGKDSIESKSIRETLEKIKKEKEAKKPIKKPNPVKVEETDPKSSAPTTPPTPGENNDANVTPDGGENPIVVNPFWNYSYDIPEAGQLDAFGNPIVIEGEDAVYTSFKRISSKEVADAYKAVVDEINGNKNSSREDKDVAIKYLEDISQKPFDSVDSLMEDLEAFANMRDAKSEEGADSVATLIRESKSKAINELRKKSRAKETAPQGNGTSPTTSKHPAFISSININFFRTKMVNVDSILDYYKKYGIDEYVLSQLDRNAEVVFITDKELSESVKNSTGDTYNESNDFPIVLAVVTKDGPITIEGDSNHYQPIAIMPSSFTRYGDATGMEAIRTQALKNGNTTAVVKLDGKPIKTKLTRVQTSSVDLNYRGANDVIEVGIKDQNSEDAEKINGLDKADRRNTKEYKAAKEKFMGKLLSRMRGSEKILIYQQDNPGRDPISIRVWVKDLGETTARDSNVTLDEALEDENFDIVHFNSRTEKAADALTKFFESLKKEEILFDSNGELLDTSLKEKLASRLRLALNNSIYLQSGASIELSLVNTEKGPIISVNISADGVYNRGHYVDYTNDSGIQIGVEDTLVTILYSQDISGNHLAKWQVNFEDANIMHSTAHGEAQRNAAETNISNAYDDGILTAAATTFNRRYESLQMHNPINKDGVPISFDGGNSRVVKQGAKIDSETGAIVEGAVTEPHRTSAQERCAKIVESVKEDSDNLELSEDETHYVDKTTGEKYARVTSVISADKEAGERFDPNSPYNLPSSNIGTGIDTFVRDFFSGKVDTIKPEDLEKHYPNASSKQLSDFAKQLQQLKNYMTAMGITVVAHDMVVRGSVDVKDSEGNTHKVNVAGTMDLLAYDSRGYFYILDMKTFRSDISGSKLDKYSRQLSLYKQFLENKYGVKVARMDIIPIHVQYPAPGKQTEYTIEGNTNQLMVNGVRYTSAKPVLHELVEVKSRDLNIEWEKLTEEERALFSEIKESLPEGKTLETITPEKNDAASISSTLGVRIGFNAASMLGVENTAPVGRDVVKPSETNWADLTKDQREAAMEAGYDATAWNEELPEERKKFLDCL